jgi:hypothetical protein
LPTSSDVVFECDDLSPLFYRSRGSPDHLQLPTRQFQTTPEKSQTPADKFLMSIHTLSVPFDKFRMPLDKSRIRLDKFSIATAKFSDALDKFSNAVDKSSTPIPGYHCTLKKSINSLESKYLVEARWPANAAGRHYLRLGISHNAARPFFAQGLIPRDTLEMEHLTFILTSQARRDVNIFTSRRRKLSTRRCRSFSAATAVLTTSSPEAKASGWSGGSIVMSKTNDEVLAAVDTLIKVWTDNPTFSMGGLTLTMVQTKADDLRNRNKLVEDARTELSRLIDESNDVRDEVAELVTRGRSGMRAAFGPDSPQYAQVGGTRASERKPRTKTKKGAGQT